MWPRNAPCWCGSQKKYKHCHLDRSNDAPLRESDVYPALRKAATRKECLHYEASRTACQGKVVAAHTVQRALLERISESNHVYRLDRDPASLKRSGGRFVEELVGLDKASTVYAFCEGHDAATFRSIEAEPIRACSQHACLLAYRATCYELYAKQGVVLLESNRNNWDRGWSLQRQVDYQVVNKQMNRGFRAGLADIQTRKASLERAIRFNDFNGVRFLFIWLEAPPDIMCAGGKNPQFTFDGVEIQDWSDLSKPAHGCSLTLASSRDRGFALFSWLPTDDIVCVPLFRSFLALEHRRQPDAIVRLVLGALENIYWRPSWWDRLFSETRTKLLDRFMLAAHPFKPIPNDFLCDDGVHLVRWNTTEITTNCTELA